MRWLDKIRSESLEKKVRLIWMITAVAFVVLVAIWILIANYQPKQNSNSSVIGQFKDTINNVKNGGH